jgi:hypothetical protein
LGKPLTFSKLPISKYGKHRKNTRDKREIGKSCVAFYLQKEKLLLEKPIKEK